MPKKNNLSQWQLQTKSGRCSEINAKRYDNIKDFKRDPSGFYVLIRPNLETGSIEVAVCNKKHEIEAVFRGVRAQDLYNAIFSLEKKHKKMWFKEKTHIAYLGKEFKKAELALSLGNSSYYQD